MQMLNVSVKSAISLVLRFVLFVLLCFGDLMVEAYFIIGIALYIESKVFLCLPYLVEKTL